ncbi:uncharacterized protein LOC120645929 [Panicum virgatum]|uniref:Uncharacterized protein n=1 Tax=Panicum virgatum TaxID=38727 RepID=A0A8T0PTE8_PANVG|nr:uncharacterized protein LOC120645929 [Panicum virgatum]KAG2563769.1 hypothetical protein PVAP13_8KG360108 [Panicum virgatum]
MAGGAGERGDGGASSSRPKEPPVRLEDVSLNTYVLAQTYLLRAVTGLGYLALTWSTVVLLGGFVTSLLKTDFWCITVISMIQAARIFDDLAEKRYVKSVLDAMEPLFRKISAQVNNAATKDHASERREKSITILYCARAIVFVLLGVTIFFPCWVAVGLPFIAAGLVYDLGPLACTGIPLWRLLKRDYLSASGGDDDGNLVPALVIFYSLVLCQGVFYCVWFLCTSGRIKEWQVDSLNRRCKLTDKLWGKASTEAYFSDTKAKCWKDPGSINGGGKLIHYAVDQLGAESWRENRSGARILDAFARQGVDLRSLLLPSRPKIQKLIDMLGWRRGPPEIRELAARIVADVAGDIHLAQFPGAIRCISSLLQNETTTQPIHWRDTNRPQRSKVPNQIQVYMRVVEKRLTQLGQQVGKVAEQKEPDGSDRNDSGCSAEMILQGLTILERLASNHHNCSDICNAPGLLSKITAPLYSGTLIQDMDISGTWPGLVSRSFRVLH